MRNGDVCLFFYIDGEFFVHGCSLEEAEHYGDFLVYPESHLDIWRKHYEKEYHVDFDFFPRGRVTYRRSDQTYLIYYDSCIGGEIYSLSDIYYNGFKGHVKWEHDEHYRCHRCNRNYVL